jgi:hypothetical protein
VDPVPDPMFADSARGGGGVLFLGASSSVFVALRRYHSSYTLQDALRTQFSEKHKPAG